MEKQTYRVVRVNTKKLINYINGVLTTVNLQNDEQIENYPIIVKQLELNENAKFENIRSYLSKNAYKPGFSIVLIKLTEFAYAAEINENLSQQ